MMGRARARLHYFVPERPRRRHEFPSRSQHVGVVPASHGALLSQFCSSRLTASESDCLNLKRAPISLGGGIDAAPKFLVGRCVS